MYQIEDILIPMRFLLLMLQIIITSTFSVLNTYRDHIRARFPSYYIKYKPKELENLYEKEEIIFFILLGIFYICEIFELIMLFVGVTLFKNKLSFVLIFFHSVCILYLNWFKHEVYESRSIYIALILGGLIPVILELFFLFSMNKYHRRIGEVK